MKNLLLLPTLKSRLAFWFTAICLVPLALLSTIIYTQRVKVARSLIFDKLNAITSTRVEQINGMLDNLVTDTSTLATDMSVQLAARALEHDTGGAASGEAMDSLNLFRGYMSSYASVADVSLVSRTGLILLSTDSDRVGTSTAGTGMVVKTLDDRQPVFGDAYLYGTEEVPSMDLAVPIKIKGEQSQAVLVVRYNLRKLLYSVTENRTGMGLTGETVIVNRYLMPLNELRALPGTVLKTRIKGKPAMMAASGENGIAQTTDYRGVEVLSSFAYIPRTGWGLVCKQDTAEVLAPIRKLLWATYGLAALISLLACIFAFRIARSISQPLVRLSSAVTRIGAGDYDARTAPEGTDELRSLAVSFNSMADTLQLKMDAQLGLSRLSERLVTAENLDDFFSRLLPVFMEVTGAKMAVAFVQDQDGDSFVPMHGIGADCRKMRSFSRKRLEGELGVMLSCGGVARFSPPPQGDALRLVTSFGDIVPAEIVTIPVSIDSDIRAFISLAAENPFPSRVHETLEMVRVPLDAAFARVVSGEDVRRLASELAIKNAELTQQSEELVQQSTELAQQSEELSRHNRVLDLQKQQLEEATRLKSEFLSNMSHELRTPLNSVLALSRVLSVQGAARLTEEERGYLSIIERNGKHLLSLINDILDLAKIESGRQEIFYETLSLEKVAAEVVDGIAAIAREKGISLTLLPAPQGLPAVVMDVKRLRQMLQNLVGNAVKFTSEGTVTVRLRIDGEEILIEVEDTGIGIAPHSLDTIFQEFRQADGSTSRSFEGTGLGLAIVKKTARLLGGDVAVASEPGKGSLFTLRLPLDCRGMAVDRQPLPAPAGERPAHQPKGRSVLVVDDDPEAVSVIAAHLNQAGFQTLTALNGPDALRLARVKRPFAITLDIMMPEMDGWEVMRELKGHPDTSDIPVLIVSLSDDRETGMALGAVGVITKPVSGEQLMESFAKLAGAGCRLVLVVDDNEHDRFFIASLFKEQGVDVLLAENGSQALELAISDHPDLITLDLMMPEMDGAAVLDKLRANRLTAEIPVVLITSKELTAAELERLSSGVSAVVSKGGLDRQVVLNELVKSLERIGWRLPEGERGKGSRILIVEDSEAATIQLRFALESAGYLVDAVSGGRHALGYLKTHVPDGIILDLMMPEVDGFNVLEAVRASKLTEGVPVMVMTAKTLSPGEHDRLRALEVNHLVQKGDVEQQELLRRVYEMLGGVTLFRDAVLSVPVTEPHPAPWQGDGSLLVVEDNPDNLVTLRAVLGRSYRIVEAADGETGLAAARAGSPSLILLDMQLPGMDGMAVLKQLKKHPATAAIPVLALTASAMTGDRDRLLRAGCAAYLSKPYAPEELQGLVSKLLAAGAAAV